MNFYFLSSLCPCVQHDGDAEKILQKPKIQVARRYFNFQKSVGSRAGVLDVGPTGSHGVYGETLW